MSKNNKSIDEIAKSTAKIKEIAETITNYSKNPLIGIDAEKLQAYVTNHRWEINPNGHIKSIRDPIKEMLKEFLKIINSQKTQLDVLDSQEKTDKVAKEILTIGLVNFDYDKEADDPQVGPVNLKYLAQEIGYFLVVQGGKEGYLHSKMLQQLDQLTQLTD